MEKTKIVKLLLTTLPVSFAIGFSALIYFSYQDFVNPKHVYGRWIEIGTPQYNTEVLELGENKVLRNERFIATHFEFDGKKIYITTGEGTFVYQIVGTFKSPQLKRLQPNSPPQRFVKEGYEDTISEEGGGAKNRRAALSEHFGS
ncbi:DUF2850 domain-containing protein [Vibrio japonicus]|uniref:DUF2850 domain-containing protein n=1 Tax=Vibrio japonicus TaxID=1824638 RepID=A0ABY5LMA1_9VIBR|nr:DUF2850 domain-containing protein [Vibrio japonicus]UUM32986.1 DUF2850 domain-containing protein [Vibrio japonicus]